MISGHRPFRLFGFLPKQRLSNYKQCAQARVLKTFGHAAFFHPSNERPMYTETNLTTEQSNNQSQNEGLSRLVLDELLEQSIAQKKGLAIYLSAQVIHAIFVRRIDENTIELRNQTSNRVIIRCDRIDAISLP
jgi:hypothetical protein